MPEAGCNIFRDYAEKRVNLRVEKRAFLAMTAMALWMALSPGGARGQGVGLDGKATDPVRQSHGKVAVLIFVRTDCPISNRYAPLIQEMSAKYRKEAAFWLVFPDKAESADKIRAYEKEYGYTLQALRDPERALAKRSGARVTPEAAVFSAKGELVYHGRIDNLYQDYGRARPAATTHELADAIEAASRGVAPATTAADGVGCYIADLP